MRTLDDPIILKKVKDDWDTKWWVGFDLDGTIARDGHRTILDEIGPPVPNMVEMIKGYLARGIRVRIVTARVSSALPADEVAENRQKVYVWLLRYVGVSLPVTAEKDPWMAVIFDDRAIAVDKNTGKLKWWTDTFADLSNPGRQRGKELENRGT